MTGLKIASLVTTVLGLGLSVAQTIIGDKQRKIEIKEAVKEITKNN